jgi:acyl-CoA reductase-like NAD-dependent aldehyde dehydrogenase
MTMQESPAKMFINGEWVDAADSATEAVINPATEAVIGHAPVGTAGDNDRAIAAARAAFDNGPWPQLPVSKRVTVLKKMLDYCEAHKQSLIELIVAEAGDTRVAAEFLQYGLPLKHCTRLLEDALKVEPKMMAPELSFAADGSQVLGTAVVHHMPIGVVTAITPYNYPFMLSITKIFHALPMGNTVVLKPSPYTPLQVLFLGRAAVAAGLPAGVLNIVTGDIASGQQLTCDPRVDMVSFTGSDKVGAAIMAQAAQTLKKVHLELGGKSALIVREDADLDKAVEFALFAFTHTGQGCVLNTRILVHNAIRRTFVDRIAAIISAMKVGDPAQADVTVGPLIRDVARVRTERYVQWALEDGARLVTGGKRPAHLDRGFYFEPTLFDDVDNRSRLAQEEVFGPIVAVIGFDTDDEAVRLANDSAFGLGGGIFTTDVGKGYEMGMRIRTGTFTINGGAGTMLSSAPFGGVKRSGIGREYGVDSLLEFTEPKCISFHGG